jgi:hypothetical protein
VGVSIDKNAIQKAWEKYHGLIEDGNGDRYIPSTPPVFMRGFVDGYEHAVKLLKTPAKEKGEG